MDAPRSTPAPVAQVLRRRWYIVLIVLVFAVGASVVFSLTRPVTYASSTKVLVESVVSSGSAPIVVDPDEMATQGQIVTSLPIAEDAAQSLGSSQDAEHLLDDVSVTTDNTRVLTVTATSSDPNDAARMANAFADSYLAFRRQEAEAQVAALRNLLNEQLTNLQNKVARIGREIESATGSGVAILQAERRNLDGQIARVQSQIARVSDSTSSAETAIVLLRAEPPSQSTRPDPVRSAALVAILGLIAGVGLALLRERWAAPQQSRYTGSESEATAVLVQK